MLFARGGGSPRAHDRADEWIGVMRHAEAFRPGIDPGKRAPGSPLTIGGVDDARGVARRFAEAIGEAGIDLSDVVIAFAPTEVARATAETVADELGQRPSLVPVDALLPGPWGRDDDVAGRVLSIREDPATDPGGGRAVLLLVGHDPQMGRLLNVLLPASARQPLAGPLPLARGALAVLTGPRGAPAPFTIRWVISPSDEKATAELREKIASKMESAKLLGTFLTAVLLLAAQELVDVEDPPGWYPIVAGAGLTLLAAATAAYFVTVFLYDRLLMPIGFWGSEFDDGRRRRRPRGFVQRPPSPASWVLYQNMMRVWNHAFIPATAIGGLGTVTVVIALARPQGLWWAGVAAAIVAVGLLTWAVWIVARPVLGVGD